MEMAIGRLDLEKPETRLSETFAPGQELLGETQSWTVESQCLSTCQA